MEQDKVLKSVLASVQKSYDKKKKTDPTMLSLGSFTKTRSAVDSGCYALNWIMTGYPLSGGYPGGRVVEIFGEASTGKSLLIYHALANVIRAGGYGILDDTEACYSPYFGELLGIDHSRLIILESITVEDHFAATEKLLEKLREKIGPEKPILIALDSLATLTTIHEKKVGFEKPSMTRAKTVKLAMRLLRPVLAKDQMTSYLIANHVIANIGNVYQPTTTPGGGGVKFQSSVRIDLQFRGKLREGGGKDGLVIGEKVCAKAVKNKMTSPFKECILEIYTEGDKLGVVRESGLFEAAKVAGVVVASESKGWNKMKNGKKKFQSATFYEEYVDKALEKMEAKSAPVSSSDVPSEDIPKKEQKK